MNLNNDDSQQTNRKQERFSTTGFIISAIGSSVGLGNMWKFPYITGENGGAAFFLLFIACLIVIGLPVLISEMALGRSGRGSAASAFVRAGGKKSWYVLGLLQVLTPFLILTFYAIVTGWTLQYATSAFSGSLFANNDFAGQFTAFSNSYLPVFWSFVALFLTGLIVILGVSKGIEKFNKFLIPSMIVLLVVLMIRAVTLPGAGEGISFFLNPDFSKLTAESALVALGHAFFSLSLGMGIILTYSSYMSKNQSIGTAAVAVGLGDLIYAFIAGLIIFPTTFSFGIQPDQGPSLVFIALPAAFSAMPFGSLFGGLFFILLAIAAITSAVSILEVPVSFTMEKFNWSRNRSVWIVLIATFAISIPLAFSIGMFPHLSFGGKALFDWIDFIASNIFLPIGGLGIIIFVGYYWKKVQEETGLSSRWFNIWLFTLRYIAPILMFLVLLHTTGIIKF
jgi:neurotransmitter:Na+ symporter, NSS family